MSKLADDEKLIVRLSVAKNPNLPEKILEKLAEDSDYDASVYAKW